MIARLLQPLMAATHNDKVLAAAMIGVGVLVFFYAFYLGLGFVFTVWEATMASDWWRDL